MKNKWWEKTVFYQIYMPSFEKEGFFGMKKRLPYLKELGIGALWLTPFYPSPRVDNGYDISDYEGVDSAYGSLEDFREFVKQAHKLGIRVIADMVLNHTSTEHPWFQESLRGRKGKEDWYIWEKEIPNNWESFFGGSAWQWQEERQAYYYHSFAKEQADLNFRNPSVLEAALGVLDFWMEQGIDGFRLDVINNLSTAEGKRDNPVDTEGRQQHIEDVNQHGIEAVLHKIREKINSCAEKDIFLVGEISSDELPLIYHYAGDELLHTTFNFNLGSKESFSVSDFAQELQRMSRLYRKELPTLFFGSHDMRRAVSRFRFHQEQCRVLCLLQMTYRGIPFVYNGEELGTPDFIYRSIEDVQDCQALIAYEEALKAGKTKEEAMEALKENSRDYSRGKMDWEEADRQAADAASLLTAYKKMIAFRNENPLLQTGSCSVPVLDNGVILYERYQPEYSPDGKAGKRMTVLLNFTGEEKDLKTWGLEGKRPVFDTSGKLVGEKLPGFTGVVYEETAFVSPPFSS